MTPNCWLKINSQSIHASANGGCFSVELAESRPGILVFRVVGPSASSVFEHEAGGHRWQRIPPTERHGRVQTSTITVAVLPEPEDVDFAIPESDLEWSTTRASGPGGQNRNKVETVAIVKHKPTGLTVRSESERSQFRNRETARKILFARLKQRAEDQSQTETAGTRKQQVGSGMRGDKRRTIRVRDEAVKDHVTGRSWQYADYVAGKW